MISEKRFDSLSLSILVLIFRKSYWKNKYISLGYFETHYSSRHCKVKGVQIRSSFQSVFSCLQTEYGDLFSPNTGKYRLQIWIFLAQYDFDKSLSISFIKVCGHHTAQTNLKGTDNIVRSNELQKMHQLLSSLNCRISEKQTFQCRVNLMVQNSIIIVISREFK